jgi:hypothetical protein
MAITDLIATEGAATERDQDASLDDVVRDLGLAFGGCRPDYSAE